MEEGLVVLRQLVVHDEFHVGHVQAAGRNVGGHQDVEAPLAEAAERLLALPLRNVAVQGLALQRLAQRRIDFVRLALGLREHNGFGTAAVHCQQIHEDRLACGGGHVDGQHLEGVRNLHAVVANEINGDGVGEVVASKLRHPRGHGGREQVVGAIRGHLGVEHLHVLLEADAEHLVRLVEDGELHFGQVQRAALHQVDHATRGAHHNVHPALEIALVVHDGHTAIAAQLPQRGAGGCDLPLDLLCQLARGGEDDALGQPAGALTVRSLLEQFLDHRKGERQRLARASARAADYVAPLHGGLQHARLDGEEVFDPARPQGGFRGLAQAEVLDR
mmetsp:Transcript_33301/g.55859  ORF Transcript_33301/g.55859 Transcript_33301/m.55859 type:complete len:332 (-) Transcript_33301:655-1650(-)